MTHLLTRNELLALIKAEDWNAVENADVSQIKDMSGMFAGSKFNGDLSSWDVSNVEDMYGMFYYSKFNGDISSWDVSNVKDMSWMFNNSKFNGDISSWDVSNVEDMYKMFTNSNFNGDISKWQPLSCTNFGDIFDTGDQFQSSVKGCWDEIMKLRQLESI